MPTPLPPLDPSALELLPYQLEALYNPARFTWNCWARQTGKSFTFSLRRIIRGLLRRRNQIILSAGERQSREVLLKVRMHCRVLGLWHAGHGYDAGRGSPTGRLEVHLPEGVRVIALPANPATARGYTGDVFLDEFAMHRHDREIWSALFPTILRGAGELDVASTPAGRSNTFYRLHENARFSRRTLTLEQAVAQGLPVHLPDLRAAVHDELTWRQEFGCEFVDEAGSFITYDLIRRCEDPRLGTAVDDARLADPAAALYAGVDVGRVRDLTAVWIWEDDDGVFVTRGVVTLQAAPFLEQEALLSDLLAHRALRRCCIDAGGLGMHMAESLVSRFGAHRVDPVPFTAALKSELAGRLRVLAERGRLRIPLDPAITADWHSIARRISAAGVRFDAGRSADGHGDRFWAAALGLHAAEAERGAVEFATAGPLRFARSGVW